MNDNTNNPREKIETAIDSEELRAEELDQAVGGILTNDHIGGAVGPTRVNPASQAPLECRNR